MPTDTAFCLFFILEFIKEAFLAASDRRTSLHSELFFKLHKNLFLPVAEALGNINYDAHKLVAPASAAENLNTLTAELEHRARLSACRDIKLNIAVKSRNADIIAESRLSVADSLLKPDIITVTIKK